MNDLTHNFDTALLAEAASRIACSLRANAGLSSESSVIQSDGVMSLAFRTGDATTRTLRDYLRHELDEAAKPPSFDRGAVPDVKIHDETGSNHKGAVVVQICPRLAGILIAKL